jgi:hypothetical protein
MRKVLSWEGALGEDSTHDPNKWHWAVLMKIFLYRCEGTAFGDIRIFDHMHWTLLSLNDEKQGDHWEAILGLEVWSRDGWSRAPRNNLDRAFLDIDRNDLVKYAHWINRAVEPLELIILPYLDQHAFLENSWFPRIRSTSRETAALMA